MAWTTRGAWNRRWARHVSCLMRFGMMLVVGAFLAGCGHARSVGGDLAVVDPEAARLQAWAGAEPDPHACERARAGELERLLNAVAEGRVPRAAAAACVVSGWLQLSAADGTRVGAGFANVYGRASAAPERALQEALQAALLARPVADLAALATRGLEGQARAALSASLQPSARALADELLAALELAQDHYQGEPLTVARLETLDEATLAVILRRLADPGLVRAAQRELIARRARRSEFVEVREHVEAVVDAVLSRGSNVVELRAHPVRSLCVEALRQPWLLKQEPELQRASLVSWGAAQTSASLPLRNVLWVELEGLSRPVTLCAGPAELEPSPCLSAGDVRGELARVPVVDGSLQLGGVSTTSVLLPLLRSAAELRVPVRVDQQTVDVVLALSIIAPEPIILSAPGVGTRGPAVHVVLRQEARWIVAEVRSGEHALMPVLLAPTHPRLQPPSRSRARLPWVRSPAGLPRPQSQASQPALSPPLQCE